MILPYFVNVIFTLGSKFAFHSKNFRFHSETEHWKHKYRWKCWRQTIHGMLIHLTGINVVPTICNTIVTNSYLNRIIWVWRCSINLLEQISSSILYLYSPFKCIQSDWQVIESSIPSKDPIFIYYHWKAKDGMRKKIRKTEK